jgi:steroid delta-isomerase
MRLEGAVRVAGQYGAAALTAIGGNGTLQVDTLDVMEFDDDGLVVRMDAYWGPTNVSRISPPASGGAS